MNKNIYVIHYRNFQQGLLPGMKFKKKCIEYQNLNKVIHYTDFNTKKRKESTQESDKNLFKLTNNAVYGKTMENIRRRIKIRVAKNKDDVI